MMPKWTPESSRCDQHGPQICKICQNGAQERSENNPNWEQGSEMSSPGTLLPTPDATWAILCVIWDQVGCQRDPRVHDFGT